MKMKAGCKCSLNRKQRNQRKSEQLTKQSVLVIWTARKKWVKQQAIRHTYESDDEDHKTSSKRVERSDFDQSVFTSSKAKACKCGSTTHFCTTVPPKRNHEK